MKKNLLFVGLTVLSIQLYAQSKSLDFSLEYAPNYSKLTNVRGFENQGKFYFSNQLFIKAEYELTRHFSITAGLGYVNTREKETLLLNGFEGIDYIDQYVNHNYILAPIGLKYNIGSFYLNPEIGFGVNIFHIGPPTKQISVLTNGQKIVQRYNDNFTPNNFNKLTMPVFLTLGKEFELKKVSLLFGLRGYYSLESVVDRPFWGQHYIGFGLMTGIRF